MLKENTRLEGKQKSVYRSVTQHINKNKFKFLNVIDNCSKFKLLNVTDTSSTVLSTMRNILSQAKFSGYDVIMSPILMNEFVFDSYNYSYFTKMFNDFINSQNNSQEQINSLVKCVVFLFKRLQVELNNKYNHDGNRICPDLKPIITALEAIYFDNEHSAEFLQDKTMKFKNPLVRGLLKEGLLTHKYFDFFKILVGLYHKETRKDFFILIKKLFEQCNYDHRQKFFRFVDPVGCQQGKISDHACYAMMCMIIQVYLKDIIISFNTALGDLRESYEKIQKDICLLSKIDIELPNFPISYSHNIADQTCDYE